MDRLLEMRHLLAMHFREEHWAALAELTGCTDVLQPYPRLGRVHWGDNAYDASVLKVLMTIVERCPGSLPEVERYVHEVCGSCDAHAFARATLTRL